MSIRSNQEFAGLVDPTSEVINFIQNIYTSSDRDMSLNIHFNNPYILDVYKDSRMLVNDFFLRNINTIGQLATSACYTSAENLPYVEFINYGSEPYNVRLTWEKIDNQDYPVIVFKNNGLEENILTREQAVGFLHNLIKLSNLEDMEFKFQNFNS